MFVVIREVLEESACCALYVFIYVNVFVFVFV